MRAARPRLCFLCILRLFVADPVGVSRLRGADGMRCCFGPREDRAFAGGRSFGDGLRGFRRVAGDVVFRHGAGGRRRGAGTGDEHRGGAGVPGGLSGLFVGWGIHRNFGCFVHGHRILVHIGLGNFIEDGCCLRVGNNLARDTAYHAFVFKSC